jgi:hypothetical protein
MANKKNVQSMTPEELAAYVEVVRQRNAVNAKKYYNEKIKTDPEKYEKFKVIHVQIIDLNRLKIKRY